MIEIIDNPTESPMVFITVEDALRSVTDNIKALRDYKDNLDLVFTGIPLQVGVKDRENITGRLAALQAQQALNETVDINTLFWRDSANTVHTWSDANTYIAWLQGIVVAYGARRGLIYYTSWQVTAQVEAIASNTALTDTEKLNQILSFDINW